MPVRPPRSYPLASQGSLAVEPAVDPSQILPRSRSARVKALAREAGFDLVGISSAEPFELEGRALTERIRAGLFSGLPWFTEERAGVSSNPRALLPQARSIISLALCYDTGEGPAGVIARYAWGQDYHDLLRARTTRLIAALEGELGAFEQRTFVDTGRTVDRAAAVRAGLGWYGKNTNVLNSRLGSWMFLAELVTTLELAPDQPTRQNCGRCTACIQACPTGALIAPYTLDNNRCISFLTIELRGPIPHELRPLMSGWIFGCDICQDVCPVNRQAEARSHPELAWRGGHLETSALCELLELDEAAFRTRFRGTAVMRTKRRGLLRNVAVALGNSGDRSAIGPLIRALQDNEPLVRGHAAWALGRLGGPNAGQALIETLAAESDAYVREEITRAYAAIQEAGDVPQSAPPA